MNNYFINGKSLTDLFTVLSQANLNIPTTNYKINGIDLSNVIAPKSTIVYTNVSHLWFNSNSNFKSATSIDIFNYFQLNIVNPTTSNSHQQTIYPGGVIIKVTTSGDISFNFPINQISWWRRRWRSN